MENEIAMPWSTPALLLIITAAMNNPATSLAEASLYQGIRRLMAPAINRSITAKNLPASAFLQPDPPAAIVLPPDPAAPPVAAPTPPPASPPGDEAMWRKRMTDAREALERDEVLVTALHSRVNALKTDTIMRDDPAQKAEMAKQLSRAQAELDRMTLQVTKDKLEIAAIEEDARKKGIPPGWIR
jgi:hypothetical protein